VHIKQMMIHPVGSQRYWRGWSPRLLWIVVGRRGLRIGNRAITSRTHVRRHWLHPSQHQRRTTTHPWNNQSSRL